MTVAAHGDCFCYSSATSSAPAAPPSQHIPSATAVAGVPSVSSTDESGIPAAAAAAAAADVTFLAIGSDLSLEAEGHDRLVIAFSDAQARHASTPSACLPVCMAATPHHPPLLFPSPALPAQLALVGNVTAAAKGPVVALVFSGGAMDVSSLLANPKVRGVMSGESESVALL